MTMLLPVSADQARERLARATQVTAPEEVALEGALGRVLAGPVVANEDLPAFPRSAMDGYAVRSADLVWGGRLSLIGGVVMGERPSLALGPGQAMAIPTGGHLPDGADAVVPVEQASEDGGGVVVPAVEAGRHVMQVGEDVARGTELLAPGRPLGASDIAALAALGQTRVAVHRRPRVAILSTGQELCPPERPAPPGKVRDANQWALGAAAAGCQITYGGLVEDDRALLEARLRTLSTAHDLVLMSGGTSVGRRDFTAEVLAGLGELLFHGVRARPGRPTAAARLGGTLVVALPGVPAAALIVFQVLVRPLLDRMEGRTRPRRTHAVRLLARQASEVGREDYLRVSLEQGVAQVITGPASSLSSLLASDGLVIIPADVPALEAGETVEAHPWL
jgi:molybdopterin molybdotransferase